MDYKRANRVFLYMILATIAFTVTYTAWVIFTGKSLNMIMNNFLSEMVVLAPAMLALLVSGDSPKAVIPLKKIRAGSAGLCVIYAVLLLPLATFASSISMLFVENFVGSMVDEILIMPEWQMLLSIGIFGPFVEEILFRGILLSSYQRTGRIVGSIVLSSLLFGIVHMNFSQFTYGVLMGIMLALLVEATGSVLASFIAHGVFNSIEVIMMYSSKDILGGAGETMTRLQADNMTFVMIGIYFIVAVICTAINFCILYKISDMEARLPFMGSILQRKIKAKLVTVPLVIAIVLAVLVMAFVELVSRVELP